MTPIDQGCVEAVQFLNDHAAIILFFLVLLIVLTAGRR